MKRHISIFAHLLCAFAAVGLAGKAAAVSYFASSTHPFTITYGGTDLKFDSYNKNSGGYYHIFYDDYGITDLTMNRDDRITAKFPDGYCFLGWYTKADGWSGDEAFISEANDCITKDQWIDGATIEDKAGRWNWGTRQTIVAKYGIIQFEVTFNTDGGTPSSIDPRTGNTIESTTITLPSVTKVGYEFAGWKNAKDNVFPAGNTNGKAFWDAGEKKFYAELTAQWTPKTYEVTYATENCTLASQHSPGTYDQPLSIAWTKGDDVQEKSTVTVYDGKDGTTKIKSVETTNTTFDFKMSDLGKYYESVVIKVACTKNVRHDLTLKKGVGVKAITWQTNNGAWVRSETDVYLPGLLATTTWAAKVEGSDVERGYDGPSSDSGTMSVDVTRELEGTPHQYTVDYDLQGGVKKSGGNYPVNENFGDIFYVSAPTRAGRSFLGWIVVPDKDDFTCAKWGTASDDVTHDVLTNMPCANGAAGDVYFKSLTSIKAEKIWLKAKWSGLTRTITVETEPQDAGSASGGGEIEEGTNAKLTATPNDGYSFCCWTNSATGLSTNANPWTFTVTADAAYTAVFTGNVYRVTYRTEGGQPENPKRTVTFGSPYGEPPVVERDGYELTGWFTDYDGEGNRIYPDTPVTTAKNHNLIACWKEKTEFTGTFIDPSGTNKTVVVEGLTKGQPVPVDKIPPFWRTGYWFNGWSPALPDTVTGNFTTYAQWLSLADVLDCPNSGLAFTIQGKWEVHFGEGSAKGGSWMQLDDGSGSSHITTSISEPGTLTFHYKGKNMQVKVGNESVQNLSPVEVWTEASVVITEASAENSVDVDFSCPAQYFSPSSLDWVVWEPGVLPTYHKVTFKDPSETFTNETQSVKDGESAIAPNWETNKFESLAWDADFSKVVTNLDVNAVWTCRVEFVDHEAGNLNLPVTNRTERGGSVASPTFTPPEGKNFGGWNPAVPEAIESNTTCVAVWTAKPVYTVSYVYEQTTNKVTKTEGDTINLLGATFTREGYTQKAWSRSEDGLSRDYEFNDPYSTDADLVLYPYWVKDAVVDPIAEALDCPDSGLAFTAAGGWSVFTNAAFAKVPPSCMSNSTAGATLTTTLKGPGTLSFWWKAGSSQFQGTVKFVVKAGESTLYEDGFTGRKTTEWVEVSRRIEANGGDVELLFSCPTMNNGVFCAIDGLVWTPDQAHPVPTEADKVTISSAAVSDGKFTLSFTSDERFDYNLLTNANLLINSWGVMGEKKVGDGKALTFEPVIIEGLPQLFYKVETIQRKD